MQNRATELQREAAVLLLLLIALALPFATLTWGRLYSRLAKGSADAAQAHPDRPLPAHAVTWSAELSEEHAARTFAAVLSALTPQAEQVDPAGAGIGGPLGPAFFTFYLPGGGRFRAVIAVGPLRQRALEAARQFAEWAGTPVATDGLRLRLDVLTGARPFPLDKRLGFSDRGFGSPVGLAVESPQGMHWFLPADVVAYGAQAHTDILNAACRRAGLATSAWRREGVNMWRIEALGFVNADGGSGRAFSSPRGLTPLPAPGAAMLLRSMRLAGGYLARERAVDGMFLTFLNPVADLRGGCESLSEQAAATAALGRLAQMTPRDEYIETCYEAISSLMRYTDSDPRDRRRAFSTRKEPCGDMLELQASAHLLEAMCRYCAASGRSEPEPWVRALGEFLLFMQREDGSFHLQYDVETGNRTTPKRLEFAVVPQAAAVVGLVLAHDRLDEPRFLLAAQRALDRLAATGDGRSWSSGDARWLLTALREFAAFLPVNGYQDLLRRIGEARMAVQLSARHAPSADLVGGTAQGMPPPAGATADDLSTFVDLALLQPAKSAIYRQAALRTARYLMQLQYTAENSYYLPSPDAARGGFREQPAMNLVRLSTLEAALRGLTGLTEMVLAENE